MACYTGSEWHVYTDAASSYNGLVLNGAHILDVAVRADSLLVLGTLNGGFHYVSDTSVLVHSTFIDGFPDNTQWGIVLDTIANERWVACPAGGLLRQVGDWYGGAWFQYASWNSDLPNSSLVSIAQDEAGSLWIGSILGGLIRRTQDDVYTTFDQSNSGLPDNTVNSVHVASDGAIWVGTYLGGAARFQPDVISSVSETANRLKPLVVPNPNTGRFVVDPLGGAAVVAWTIRDASGKIIISDRGFAKDRLVEIEVDVQPGCYAFEVETVEGIRTSKFIVY